MNYSYIIIDDDQESVLKTKAIADSFSELVFVASANNYTDGLNLILEHTPKLIFLEIDPANKERRKLGHINHDISDVFDQLRTGPLQELVERRIRKGK